MALLDQLLPASYKGASFLISSASTSGGRKDQLHSFPNSDRQTIEDLGLLPRTYSVVGWIAEPNYVEKRDALLAALEDSSVGVLSHPFYGEINRIKARSFSINESLDELGRAEFSMLFSVSNDFGLPKETDNTLSLINSSNDATTAAANVEIKENWKVETKFLGNFTAAKTKLELLKDAFSKNSKIVVQATDKINAFNAQISDFGNEINSLISKPQALATSITNLVEGMNGLYSKSEQQLAAWKEFFGFGDDDVVSVNKTAGLTQRNKNNNIINQTTQVQALSNSYLAAAEANYFTVDDLDNVSNRLEKQYQKVANGSLREQITEMRENTNSLFDQIRINLNRIITIRTAELPARVISYQYYANSSIGEEIANLNNDANVSFLEGQIQVVSQ